jgi:hypothetical protein
MTPPALRLTTRASRPDIIDKCDEEKEPVSYCHLDEPHAKLSKMVEELEMSIGALTAEASEALKSIGYAPDRAKGTPGSGLAKTIVEIQDSVNEVKTSVEEINQERTETKIQKVNNTDLVLKKVQTVGGFITSISGVIGIIGALVLGVMWIIQHVH